MMLYSKDVLQLTTLYLKKHVGIVLSSKDILQSVHAELYVHQTLTNQPVGIRSIFLRDTLFIVY